jgi:2-polyprenyl-3-methyl-5-hydroxy-6-metoxy-1,4-benzoquinol methylase
VSETSHARGVHPAPSLGYSSGPTLLEMNSKLSAKSAEWPTFEACPVCLSRRINEFAIIRHFRHSRCTDCGLTFVDPTPPPEILYNFYNSTFYSNYRRVENDRARAEPYYMISMYTDKHSLAKRVISRKPQSVLDYACGSGAFLALLRDEYGVPKVEGFEISEPAREVAINRYSLDVAPSPDALRHGSYDFVLLMEVIEHVPDPVEFLAAAAARVSIGGYVLITTPAVDSFIGRRGQICPHYTAPSHLTLFTVRALQVLLEKSGFETVEMTTDRPRGLARQLVGSLLYRLDFASPGNAEDVNDQWYRPNSLGRILGLQAGRDPMLSRRFLRLLRKATGSADRIVPQLGTDHLYVVARRKLHLQKKSCRKANRALQQTRARKASSQAEERRYPLMSAIMQLHDR